MEKIKSNYGVLKKFGLGLGTSLLIITLFIFSKYPRAVWITSLFSLMFYSMALINPRLLNPFYSVTTKVSFIITWILSRFALTVIFYFLFTPMGLIMKLFRMDLLDKKIDINKASYWKKKEADSLGNLRYEKQF